MEQKTPIEEQVEEQSEMPTQILFVFKGKDMTLKHWQMTPDVSLDQLLYLATWLDWYARMLKDDARLKSAMNQIQVPEMGAPIPRIVRPGEHGAVVPNHGNIRP